MATTQNRSAIENEMKEMLGLVPAFMQSIPDRFIEQEWELFKQIELGETHIPNKYKELMGIGIHSETKCRYCTLFHTEAARLFGATEEEIQEAVHYAKTTLGWSAYLNGMQIDYEQFKTELERVSEHIKRQQQVEGDGAPKGDVSPV